ncbi:MAG: hypothetical protein FOGNACKC_02881 [Anaerolineae bacterium]|nr:hypothetical protein [Anaerolineae bacterium]
MANPLKRVDCVRCGKQHVAKFPLLFTCPDCKALLPDSFVFIVLILFPGLGMLCARLVLFLMPVEAIETNPLLNSTVGQFLARSLSRFDSLFSWFIPATFEFPDTIPMLSIYGWQDIPSSLRIAVFGVGFAIGLYIYRITRYPIIRRLGWVYEKRSDSWLSIKRNKATTDDDGNDTAVPSERPSVVESQYYLSGQLTVYKGLKYASDLIAFGGGNVEDKKGYFHCPRCHKRLQYPSPPHCPACNRDMQDFVKISEAPLFQYQTKKIKATDKHYKQLEQARQNLAEAQEELNYAIANKSSEYRISEARNLVGLAEKDLRRIESKIARLNRQ